MGFSPCIGCALTNGVQGQQSLAGAEALVFWCLGCDPTEVVPSYKTGHERIFGSLLMRLPCVSSPSPAG